MQLGQRPARENSEIFVCISLSASIEVLYYRLSVIKYQSRIELSPIIRNYRLCWLLTTIRILHKEVTNNIVVRFDSLGLLLIDSVVYYAVKLSSSGLIEYCYHETYQ